MLSKAHQTFHLGLKKGITEHVYKDRTCKIQTIASSKEQENV